MDFSVAELEELKTAVLAFVETRMSSPTGALKKDFEFQIAKAELETKTSPDKRCQPIFSPQSYLLISRAIGASKPALMIKIEKCVRRR